MNASVSSSLCRLTPQRQVIMEELAKVKTHPTASEVYDMVRKRIPRIGLGTVYRNLDLMAEKGLIIKLEVSGSQKRFDATTAPHYHIRCIKCGRVDDVDMEPLASLESQVVASTAYQVLGHNVEFTGVCSDCQGR